MRALANDMLREAYLHEPTTKLFLYSVQLSRSDVGLLLRCSQFSVQAVRILL